MSDEIRELRLTAKLSNNRIRVLRERKGLTQQQAADGCGLSYGAWCGYESLRTSPIRVKESRPDTAVRWRQSASKIAQFLGVTEDYLWPEAVLEVKQSRITAEVDAANLRPELTAAHMRSAGLLPEAPLTPEAELGRARLMETMGDYINQMQNFMTRDQARVLRLRFGLDRAAGTDDEEELTYGEIGQSIGVSRERARQLEHEALERLRKHILESFDTPEVRAASSVLDVPLPKTIQGLARLTHQMMLARRELMERVGLHKAMSLTAQQRLERHGDVVDAVRDHLLKEGD